MSFHELKIHGTTDFPVELYHINKHSPKYEMVHHWHSNMEIVRIESGRFDISLNGRKYIMNKGDIVIVNPEIVHSGVPYECVYECMVFNPKFIPPINTNGHIFSEELANSLITVHEFFSAKDDLFNNIVNKMFEEMGKGSPGARYNVEGLLCLMCGEILDRQLFYVETPADTAKGSKLCKLKNVLSFIRESYSRDITLSDMANEAGVSVKYFCTFFKEMTNKSPVDYLIAYRIERASRLLCGTDMSVTEIAYACGFNDLSYFIKTFKSQKKMTPGAFRKV